MSENFWEELEKGAERERQEKNKRFPEDMGNIRKQAKEEKRKDQELFNKALDSQHQDLLKERERKVAQAKEEAKRKTEKEIEERYGVPSEKTEKINNAFREMLKELS